MFSWLIRMIKREPDQFTLDNTYPKLHGYTNLGPLIYRSESNFSLQVGFLVFECVSLLGKLYVLGCKHYRINSWMNTQCYSQIAAVCDWDNPPPNEEIISGLNELKSKLTSELKACPKYPAAMKEIENAER